MPMTSFDELYESPWGIVAHRRAEIEGGSHGALDRAFKEEVDQQFVTIEKVAQIMNCHESTARKWAHQEDIRYILASRSYLYFVPDVQSVNEQRTRSKIQRSKP